MSNELTLGEHHHPAQQLIIIIVFTTIIVIVSMVIFLAITRPLIIFVINISDEKGTTDFHHHHFLTITIIIFLSVCIVIVRKCYPETTNPGFCCINQYIFSLFFFINPRWLVLKMLTMNMANLSRPLKSWLPSARETLFGKSMKL